MVKLVKAPYRSAQKRRLCAATRPAGIREGVAGCFGLSGNDDWERRGARWLFAQRQPGPVHFADPGVFKCLGMLLFDSASLHGC